MNTYEQIAVWYLRLNGYFTMPNFIAHGDAGPRTEVDVLGVRFPHSREYPDDTRQLNIPGGKVDVVFAEAKPKRCRLNGPWNEGKSNRALEYVLGRVGLFDGEASVGQVARELYTGRKFENDSLVVRIICFGGKRNGTLREVTQVLWPDVISFMMTRFRTYEQEKADHQHWDSFGRYLWDRLISDRQPQPTVEGVVTGWETKCPCWPG